MILIILVIGMVFDGLLMRGLGESPGNQVAIKPRKQVLGSTPPHGHA